MLADYESDGGEEEQTEDDKKQEKTDASNIQLLKISKDDIEFVNNRPDQQIKDGKNESQMKYRDIPTHGACTLNKRKPDHFAVREKEDKEFWKDHVEETIVRSDLNVEEIQEAKKKLIPTQLKTNRPNKPIEF